MAAHRQAAGRGDQAYLSLRRLTKTYGELSTVKALDLDVAEGEMIALLGPSGCGKTSTLRMIAGLTEVSAGRVSLAGEDITRTPVHKRNIGLVFQSYALFPHLTIAENVGFGLRMRGLSRAEVATAVASAIAQVRLNGMEGRRPRQLSGGQQQRVALARALVTNPRLLLLDEPLSNLDAKLRDELRFEVRDAQQRHGTTTLFVTHDQTEALSMCDRVAVMNEGRIEQIGAPSEIYERPATPFVASFVGRINRFPARPLQGGLADLNGSAVRCREPLVGEGTIMIRPHRISIRPDAGPVHQDEPSDNQVTGTVARVTYVGDLVQYEVECGGTRFVAEKATQGVEDTLAPGTRAHLSWAASDAMVFGTGR